MAGWLTPYYAYAFFVQLSVAIVLATRRGGSRFSVGILAALFVCNALVTAATFLRLTIGQGHDAFIREMQVFDAPTGLLIFAYVAARRGGLGGDRIATGILALTGVLFYLHQPWIGVPFLSDPAPEWLVLVQQNVLGPVFHLSVLVAVLALARGNKADRWVALALAPRFLFWALHTWSDIGFLAAASRLFSTGLFGPAWVLGDFILLYGLLPMLVALTWSLRGPDAPPVVIVITAIAVAFLTALVSMNEQWRDVWVGVMANLVTLVFIRSFFVMAGLTPDRLGVAFARPLLPASLFAFVWLLQDSGAMVMGPPQVALVLAAVVSLTTFALMEHFWPRLTHPDIPDSARPALAAVTGAAPPSTTTDPQEPQWTRLLVALAGSTDDVRLPSAAWTQQGLADVTGISVKRVSDLPKQLNDRAEQRLDQWVPEWRAHSDQIPLLVTKHRGVVEGVAGPRVYYRLTEWGDRLRQRVQEANGNDGVDASPVAQPARSGSPA